MTETILDLIRPSNHDSMQEPGGDPISYAGLRRQVEHLAGQLAAAGITRGDRVALVLENGPAAAVAFLAVAVVATAAPLNPSYRTEEFANYITDLSVRAIITQPNSNPLNDSRLSDVTRLSLVGGLGSFTLLLEGRELGEGTPSPTADADIALVLHTSGTTSKPKIVPLTHANLITSVGNMIRALALSAADRYLNVMPLYHIHGLVSVLATLAANGCVVCTPGFHAFRFFQWLRDAEPTWFSAVPTMHQVILERAARQDGPTAAQRLRFIRSSSAPLPPIVMERLEGEFGVPVIEAYGMTEAAHLIACNPLPPGERKAGSVGLGAGVELGIMRESGDLLGPGATGEVVISGKNVLRGYEDNEVANQSSFSSGWFRTGDQGYLDGDGYLFLTGRLKEIINRGGEKVSPPEIDDVLLRHPAVSRAVAFAMPDDRLGEEVAAAVVLHQGMDAEEKGLRDHAARHLASFKVPRRIVIVDELPLGPTGKVQRLGMAERLGLTSSA